jgi:hypothetical protein
MPLWVAQILTWLADKLLLPLLKDWWKTQKVKKEIKNQQEQDAKKVEEYVKNPSDSSYGDAP